MSDDSNIRSTGYFIARTLVPCRSCGRSTGVLALAVPPGHERADGDTDDGTWQSADLPAFLFFLSWLPERVLQQIATHSKAFRLDDGDGSLNRNWSNHCEHCDELLSDEDLHCEPGAFLAFSEAEAANIQIQYIHDAFEAAAAGYAPDPAFIPWPSIFST
ncbi:MAG TPA: hypothetical protein VGI65_13800 [Steroidobacteraceae bacterium]|jgi:hypothetical protein